MISCPSRILFSPRLDEGGADSGERLRCVVSPYDVESTSRLARSYVISCAKQIQRLARIVYMELDL